MIVELFQSLKFNGQKRNVRLVLTPWNFIWIVIGIRVFDYPEVNRRDLFGGVGLEAIRYRVGLLKLRRIWYHYPAKRGISSVEFYSVEGL